MTATPNQSGLTMEAVDRCTVEVRWRLSGTALRRARTDLDLGDADAMLCIGVDVCREASVVATRAVLETDRGECRLEREIEGGSFVLDDVMAHVDVPGLISATIILGESPRLIYARTPLVESLGLAPGTYEPVGSATSRTSFRR